MKKESNLSKSELIENEFKKLKRIFKNLDENKKKLVLPLIEKAAFMSVQLNELQDSINENGCVETYQNGKEQYGQKKSPEIEIYLAMSKNYANIIKQLTELVPAAERKKSKLEAMKNL